MKSIGGTAVSAQIAGRSEIKIITGEKTAKNARFVGKCGKVPTNGMAANVPFAE